MAASDNSLLLKWKLVLSFSSSRAQFHNFVLNFISLSSAKVGTLPPYFHSPIPFITSQIACYAPLFSHRFQLLTRMRNLRKQEHTTAFATFPNRRRRSHYDVRSSYTSVNWEFSPSLPSPSIVRGKVGYRMAHPEFFAFFSLISNWSLIFHWFWTLVSQSLFFSTLARHCYICLFCRFIAPTKVDE